MGAQGTFASVTDTDCGCHFLQRAADDPQMPIVFDKLTGEFYFRYNLPVSGGEAKLFIYHCPFCGGMAPKSKTDLLFAVIPLEEEMRLAALMQPIHSIRDALEQLGKPDDDNPSGTTSTRPEENGRPPVVRHHRTLRYKQLSTVANIDIAELPDQTIHWQLVGKYIGPPRSPGE